MMSNERNVAMFLPMGSPFDVRADEVFRKFHGYDGQVPTTRTQSIWKLRR